MKIVLLIAAVFAIGSIGFFTAIFLGETGTASPQVKQITLTPSQKDAMMQSLAQSDRSAASTSNATTTGGSVSGVPASQADTTDQSAAQKLQILESLNAH